jgi:hypothetical protein
VSISVGVYLNNHDQRQRRGYVPGDPLRMASSWEEFTPCRADLVLNKVLRELGSRRPESPWSRDFHASRNRVFGVGDVVLVGQLGWAFSSAGWSEISLPEARFS